MTEFAKKAVPVPQCSTVSASSKTRSKKKKGKTVKNPHDVMKVAAHGNVGGNPEGLPLLVHDYLIHAAVHIKSNHGHDEMMTPASY